MKIATWNVNSLKVRLAHVLTWLKSSDCDVLALQETKCTDENFPEEEIKQEGFNVVFSGQKTYNGVSIISKQKITNVTTGLSNFTDPQCRTIFAYVNGVKILNVYIPNGSEIGTEKYSYKLNWLKHLQKDLENHLKEQAHLVLLGDFNIAPRDEDVYDPEVWQDKILCSVPERDAFNNFINAGMVDTFRQFEQAEKSYSWWDYRQASFRRNMGMRIDFVLASTELSKTTKSCIIDKEPRKLERPSDHTPVMAEFTI